MYDPKLKELKQKRILARLKKINEKRRKYHSVSTEGKVLFSTSVNSVVSSETTTVSLTNSKIAQNYEDQKHMQKNPDTSERFTKSESPKNGANYNVSDNVSVKDYAILTQSSSSTVTTVKSPGGESSKAPNGEDVAKTTSVMKLYGSPAMMNDTVKEEIHKLLQEEESRTIKVESAEQSDKLLKKQSNFEAGLLQLQNPNEQCLGGRRSSASPVSGNTLSTSSSNAVFMSPPISKTVSKTSGVLEESDDDDNVSKELKMLDAIVASKHEEELVAKKSRERMLKAYSVEKSNIGVFGGTKKLLIDCATVEVSPIVWHGLIEERRKKWLANHSLWK